MYSIEFGFSTNKIPQILYDLHRYFADQFQDFIGNDNNSHVLCTNLKGNRKFDLQINDQKINFEVMSKRKNGYFEMIFQNKSDYDILIHYIENEKSKLTKPIQNPLYKFTRNGWTNIGPYNIIDSVSIIGSESIVQTLNDDMYNRCKYAKFLESIGENAKSFNYLLTGPPGTGKSSIVKIFGNQHNLPIYIINAALVGNITDLSILLNPAGDNKKILIFEDFDHFLKNPSYQSQMSSILNNLDGLDDKGNIIRFFTCNDPDIIYETDALKNRMSKIFNFTYPDYEMFLTKLKQLLEFHSDNKNHTNDQISVFLHLFDEKPITMRPFVSYVLRYLFRENYMDAMISNINELIS